MSLGIGSWFAEGEYDRPRRLSGKTAQGYRWDAVWTGGELVAPPRGTRAWVNADRINFWGTTPEEVRAKQNASSEMKRFTRNLRREVQERFAEEVERTVMEQLKEIRDQLVAEALQRVAEKEREVGAETGAEDYVENWGFHCPALTVSV